MIPGAPPPPPPPPHSRQLLWLLNWASCQSCLLHLPLLHPNWWSACKSTNPTVCLFSDDSLHPQDKELPPRVALMESGPAHLYLPTPFKGHTPDLSVSQCVSLSLSPGLCPSCPYSRSCPSPPNPSTDHTAAPFSSQGVSRKLEMSHVRVCGMKGSWM